VQQYEVEAVRTAYLVTHDRALAEDVVQSTFLRIYQRIDQYDTARPFKPWFMRSVVNAAIQAAKRHQRTLSLDATPSGSNGDTFADLLADPAPGPDDEAEHAELRRTVWRALGDLSPDQRAAVVLRYYLELSDDDISAQLDIAPSTVRWRLHAARKQLRGLLQRVGLAQGWQEG
jgi:RNA polymerase sigma-70 factor (ECF subfamily)